ncbi:MAG: hypothetical protein JXA14_26350 [Anaerolineae bacterium]|nr:hypothetical protein [Anaerolineae bacterium]
MPEFTSAAWSSPEGDLDTGNFCACCLIDENARGEEKVKGKCHLPIRKEPGGPVYVNALRAAMGGHGVLALEGVSAEAKRAAARSLVRLAAQAGIEVTSSALLRLAGKKAK